MPCYYPFYDETNQPRPCRKCPYCLSRRANNWIFRCMQEAKVADSSLWVTLTYDCPPTTDNRLHTLRKSDVQKFFKRLRKKHRDFSNQKIKYFAVGEYGSKTHRPHYHVVLFNSSVEHILSAWEGFWSPSDENGVVLGHCYIDQVNEQTVAYSCKYMFKKFRPLKGDDREPPSQLTSKDIGINFLDDATRTFFSNDIRRNYVTVNGFKKALPEYFAKKIHICPVQKVARLLYAQEQSARTHSDNYVRWEKYRSENKNFDKSLLSWLAAEKHQSVVAFNDRLSLRNKV